MANKPTNVWKIIKGILIAVLIAAILGGCLALLHRCGESKGWFDWFKNPFKKGQDSDSGDKKDDPDSDKQDPDSENPNDDPITAYTVRFVNGEAVIEIRVAENTAIGDQMPENAVVMGDDRHCPFSSGWYSNDVQITRDTIVTSNITATPHWEEAEYHKYMRSGISRTDYYRHECIPYECSRCGYQYVVVRHYFVKDVDDPQLSEDGRVKFICRYQCGEYRYLDPSYTGNKHEHELVDGYCEICGEFFLDTYEIITGGDAEHDFMDNNGDGKCDECGKSESEHNEGGGEGINHDFKDSDGDGKCDECGKSESEHNEAGDEGINHDFADSDSDGVCDECGKSESEHVNDSEHEYKDSNGDGICDTCGIYGVDHESASGDMEHAFQDGDGDLKCDECGKSKFNHGAWANPQHTDGDKDSYCDFCDNPMDHDILAYADGPYYHTLKPEPIIDFPLDTTSLVCFTAFTSNPGVGDTKIVFEFDDGIWGEEQMYYSVNIEQHPNVNASIGFQMELKQLYLEKFVFTDMVFTLHGSASHFERQVQIYDDGIGITGNMWLDNTFMNDSYSWLHVRVYCGLNNLKDNVKLENSKGSDAPLSVVSQGVFRYFGTLNGLGVYVIAVEFYGTAEFDSVQWKALKDGKNYTWDMFFSWNIGQTYYFAFRLETLNEMLDLFKNPEGTTWQNNCHLLIQYAGEASLNEMPNWSDYFEVEKDADVSFIFIQNEDGTITLYFWTESGSLDVSLTVDSEPISEGIISSNVGGSSGSVTFEFELCQIEGYHRVWTIVKTNS